MANVINQAMVTRRPSIIERVKGWLWRRRFKRNEALRRAAFAEELMSRRRVDVYVLHCE